MFGRSRFSPFGGANPFDDPFGGLRGRPGEFKQNALGSGFLIGNGLALTNHHVIDGADEIKVKTADGKEWSARVVGRDASTDVALLELSGAGAKEEPGVTLGDSSKLEVGDYVVAIGNPFGLQLTVTSGIVSAMGRVLGAGPYDDFIQTDASINPGNSGGPLFNLAGEVVGINTAIIERGQGIGFAVPISMVKTLLPQLKDAGRVSRGWLGISMQELTPALTAGLNLKSAHGVLVGQVLTGGPAARGGLQDGDVVVALNDAPVDAPPALSRAVATISPGANVALKVLRDGKEVVVRFQVGERPDDGARASSPNSAPEEAPGSFSVGLAVEPLSPERARRLGVPADTGVLVADVAPHGAAEAAGVQPGDVLLELQRQPTRTPESYRTLARDVKSGEQVVFKVRRGAGTLYLAAPAPAK